MSDVSSSDDEQLLTDSEEISLAARGYRFTELLGSGSYAKVYKSTYENSKSVSTNLACKVVDVSKASKDFAQRFLPRELDIIARLTHPHIVHVHSIFQRRTKYYIFMRFCERGDLLGFVLEQGPIPEVQSRGWFRQIALAIQHLHGMGIAHRDIKCENILITGNFNLKLADFGFAREVLDSDGKLKLCETYCGSLSYVSPEVLKAQPYDALIADIWSLGVVLYIMLNKAMPFDDNNINKLYKLQLNSKWNYRSKVINKLSKDLKEFLPHILEPVVEKRYTIKQVLTSEWINMDPETSGTSLVYDEPRSLQRASTSTFLEIASATSLQSQGSKDNANNDNSGRREKQQVSQKSSTKNKKSIEKKETSHPVDSRNT